MTAFTQPPAVDWHTFEAGETLERLSTTPEGLSASEAHARLARHGPNLLELVEPVPAWRLLLDQVRSVVVLLLFAAMFVALAFGEIPEAVSIGVVLLLNTLLGFATELRARRAMEALLELEVPEATVIRGGEPELVEARTLVPGDVIRVAEGEVVPADARLVESTELQINEAPLTGESLPVAKQADIVLPAAATVPERRNMLHKSTAVVSGSGDAVVVETGMDTQVGRIGRLAGEIVDEKTPLERRLDRLGRRLVWITLALAGVVTLVGWLQGSELFHMVETGIALAIAAVPEGLPAVATIALAVGLRRMARREALIRRLPAVESLGSTTVVCTDKTGTLTAGQMTATRLWLDGRDVEITGQGYEADGGFRVESRSLDPAADRSLALALRIGLLAGHARLDRDESGRWEVRGDPTEAALLVAARKAGLERDRILEEWPKLGEVPFSSARRLMATFHRTPAGLRACVKGAPGRILELCSRRLEGGEELPLGPADRTRIADQNARLAEAGLRVLALATATVEHADESALEQLTFVGLAGIMDPPAEGVRETIARFRDAGIRVVMITGDQRETAEAVARELDLLGADEEVVDGRELRESAAGLGDRIRRAGAFSRVGPEDKLGIVGLYQEAGEIVAMLGDGVNDAAALKKADVGVAMGMRGTDIAREAADVVLRDDRFPTLAVAVEQGRVIFDNIRKFVFYLFSCNAAEVMTLFVAGVVGLRLPLQPLQILWLNLVTDTFPALALAMEPADPGVMRRPPRDPAGPVLSRGMVRAIATYAVLITGVTLVAYLVALSRAPGSYETATTWAFMTLAVAQILHLGNARSPQPVLDRASAVRNRWALAAVVVALGLQACAVYVTPLARLLGVVRPAALDWLLILALGAVPAVVGQGVRWLRVRGGRD
ncbi:MAG: cation-transporting P-type ATPase [Gemmatimonadales bacterium]